MIAGAMKRAAPNNARPPDLSDVAKLNVVPSPKPDQAVVTAPVATPVIPVTPAL
jgi:hypothetical protein